MPEGHTIHRAARDHQRALGGSLVKVSSPQGRFDCSELVDRGGRVKLQRVEAFGKHLFYVFSRERIVHVHLGLFGKFFRRRSPAAEPRETTRMRLEGEAVTIDLVGPTACELMGPTGMQEITSRLGPDPLRADADPAAFIEYAARSSAPIGAILLDQRRICGVGNVYRAELLHMLCLHPHAPGASIPRERLDAMWGLSVGLLERGVAERRIVTTRGLQLARPRERVPRWDSTHVYGRATCRTCASEIRKELLRARVIYYCPRCQPLG